MHVLVVKILEGREEGPVFPVERLVHILLSLAVDAYQDLKKLKLSCKYIRTHLNLDSSRYVNQFLIPLEVRWWLPTLLMRQTGSASLSYMPVASQSQSNRGWTSISLYLAGGFFNYTILLSVSCKSLICTQKYNASYQDDRL